MSKGSMSIYVENRGAHQARSMPRDAWLLQTACILSCKQSGVPSCLSEPAVYPPQHTPILPV